MEKKRVIVLGGGISGLVAAYRLKEEFDVTLIEKEERVGGCLRSEDRGGFFFEKGPRTFKVSRSKPLLDLAEELSLPIVLAQENAQKRYLYTGKKMHLFPSLLSPITLKALLSLIKEVRVPPSNAEDQSIDAFVTRRFGSHVARYFFDPLTIGIYGGDSKTLSVRSCFPALFAFEQNRGSVVKGMIGSMKKQPKGLCTIEGGVEQLAMRLREKIGNRIVVQETAIKLEFFESHVNVITDRNHYQADCVISALPALSLASIIGDQELREKLLSIPYKDLTVVNVGYDQIDLVTTAFGYLIPSFEQEPILGMVFDSAIFEEKKQTRLSVMIAGSEKTEGEYQEIALRALRDHLKIDVDPRLVIVTRWKGAVPQFFVGYHRFLETLKVDPRLYLTGSYVGGVSVSDCIKTAEQVAGQVSQELRLQPQVL